MPSGCPLGKKDHEFGKCEFLGESDSLIYFNGIYKCEDCMYDKMNEQNNKKDYIDTFNSMMKELKKNIIESEYIYILGNFDIKKKELKKYTKYIVKDISKSLGMRKYILFGRKKKFEKKFKKMIDMKKEVK